MLLAVRIAIFAFVLIPSIAFAWAATVHLVIAVLAFELLDAAEQA